MRNVGCAAIEAFFGVVFAMDAVVKLEQNNDRILHTTHGHVAQ